MRFLAVSLALMTSTVIAPRPGASGSGCGDTRYPRELPAPSTLVDSASATAELAALAGPAKPMVFSLIFRDGDSVPTIRRMDKGDDAAAATLAKYVRRQQPAQLWAIRVRITGGDTPALTLARSQYCPPLPRSPIVPVTVRTTIAQRPGRVGVPVMPAGAAFDALISVTGKVLVAQLTQSSGVPQADGQFLARVQQQRFQPAKLDGEFVEAWYRSAAESPRP